MLLEVLEVALEVLEVLLELLSLFKGLQGLCKVLGRLQSRHRQEKQSRETQTLGTEAQSLKSKGNR